MNTLVRIVTSDQQPHYVSPQDIVHVCSGGSGRQRAASVFLRNGHSFDIAVSVDDFVGQVIGQADGGRSSALAE